MPQPTSTQYLYAYDISDDRERRKVEKLLMGYGFRRQYSVFVCRLTRSNKARLTRELEQLALTTGFVLTVRIAHDSPVETIGTCTNPDLDSHHAFII